MSPTARRLYISSLTMYILTYYGPSLFQFARNWLPSPQGNSKMTVPRLSVVGTLYSDSVDGADDSNEHFIGFGTQDNPLWNDGARLQATRLSIKWKKHTYAARCHHHAISCGKANLQPLKAARAEDPLNIVLHEGGVLMGSAN
eukprot:scpid106867/ scgid19199/ 